MESTSAFRTKADVVAGTEDGHGRIGLGRAIVRRALAAVFVIPFLIVSVRAVPAGAVETNGWWAIQPLERRAVSATRGEHPIDAWLREAGVRVEAPLAGPEGRMRLLRRLTVDLHGLIPTPEEVEAFQARVGTESDVLGGEIDRLLASPRYGERWARHWLDVVHFAETHGHDQDRPRESAWPYRDYVITAFNSDKPYARFVQEQIAADALFPDEPEWIPALGFLAAGPWDESSLRDIREDVLDREVGRYLDRDDIVGNVMSTFASVTAQCARCHDHKFDPIPQRDYYALQAVFAGTEKAERLYDLDPAMNARRQRLMRLEVALERKDLEVIEEQLTSELRRDLEAWEQTARSGTVAWRQLRPERWATGVPSEWDMNSGLEPGGREGEVGLKRLDDDSLLATGESSATNMDVVTLTLPISAVTAVRLEVLPDDSLPARGPGRAENGNFHLTGIGMQILAAGSGAWRNVGLTNASASFNQDGWDISKVFDKDRITGWGIHPQEGKPHSAVFEWAGREPVSEGDRIRVVLRQEHGRGHTLGRYRFSVTSDPPPIRASGPGEAVLRALAVSAADRAPEQKLAVYREYLPGRVSRELASMPAPKRVYSGAHIFPANAGQKPLGRVRDVQVLGRGEILKPLEKAGPGALACVPGLAARFEATASEAHRRAALARWLADRGNPLVWRSIVNRVWHYHFGRGLVETPNDFGRMGGKPANRELLDGLAVMFRDELGGSLKELHRLILTSAVWRQGSVDPLAGEAFRPLRRRMDAETFRDSVLLMADRLDFTMGGPSVKQFAMSDGIHVTPNVNYAAFDVDSPGNSRRSIYRFLFRTLPDPLMDALDCPAGDQSAPTRSESFTALQAFALLNHPFVVRQSENMARRVEREAAAGGAAVDAVVRRTWLRKPTTEEGEDFAEYAARHGVAALCRFLWNGNEFHFID